MARVAILIDGDNIATRHAPRIAALGKQAGRADIHRAYADAAKATGWSTVPGVRLVHAGTGKNAADLLLTVEAMEMVLTAGVETVVIASSDGDFTHLATRLREIGIKVIGAGEAKAPAMFRAACAEFYILSAPEKKPPAPKAPPSKLDLEIRAAIELHSQKGSGMRIALLGPKTAIRISSFPEKTWRKYLEARPSLYDLDPRGPDAHVRFRPEGFRD
ncbi:MAG: NYN domain-containing protein [Maritimibacter sp.]|nr:NYN domain-containing protein [Maritimibacter sp.]